MRFLLDSNCWVSYLRHPKSSIRSQLQQRPPTQVLTCSIVVTELRRGALRSARPLHHLPIIEALLGQYISLPFDDSAAKTHARIRVDLEQLGLPIGPYDTMIAAIVLTHGVTLVTHNVSEFSRVPGLLIEDWQTP